MGEEALDWSRAPPERARVRERERELERESERECARARVSSWYIYLTIMCANTPVPYPQQVEHIHLKHTHLKHTHLKHIHLKHTHRQAAEALLADTIDVRYACLGGRGVVWACVTGFGAVERLEFTFGGGGRSAAAEEEERRRGGGGGAAGGGAKGEGAKALCEVEAEAEAEEARRHAGGVCVKGR